MAKFVSAWQDRGDILALLVQRESEADGALGAEYRAAVCIQSWFRGCRVRAYLAHLHASAVIIQRNFRGHLGRERYRKMLEESLDEMRVGCYERMAILIQRNWRGYYVRKFIFNYRAYKEYLKGVMFINEITRARIKEEMERAEQEKLTQEEEVHELKQQDQARRHHYLLSTYTKEGIFRAGTGRKAHPFEERMRLIHFAPSEERRSTKTSLQPWVTGSQSVSTSQQWPSVGYDVDSKLTGNSSSKLPPLVRPQGPFKTPEEVKRLRLRPPNPTLRAETIYECQEIKRAELKAEEWQRRVIDTDFLHFSKTTPPPYEGLVHTQSSFHNSLPYTYRKYDSSKDISRTPFKTILQPITTFDSSFREMQ